MPPTPSLRPLIVVGGLVALWLSQAYADPIQSHQSSGLTAGVEALTSRGRFVTAQITLKNDTATRLYLTDARYDSGQKAFLGSGDQLGAPNVAGIAACNANGSDCMRDRDNNTTEKMAYVEPGDTLTFSLSYVARTPPSASETMSFSLALVTRAAKTVSAPGSVGPTKQIRFSFSALPITEQ